MVVRRLTKTLCHLVPGPRPRHKVGVHKVGVHKVIGTRSPMVLRFLIQMPGLESGVSIVICNGSALQKVFDSNSFASSNRQGSDKEWHATAVQPYKHWSPEYSQQMLEHTSQHSGRRGVFACHRRPRQNV